jgi:hypothetical protein
MRSHIRLSGYVDKRILVGRHGPEEKVVILKGVISLFKRNRDHGRSYSLIRICG